MRTAVVHEHDGGGPHDGAEEEEEGDGLVVHPEPVPRAEVRDGPLLRARLDAQARLPAEPVAQRLVPRVGRGRGEGGDLLRGRVRAGRRRGAAAGRRLDGLAVGRDGAGARCAWRGQFRLYRTEKRGGRGAAALWTGEGGLTLCSGAMRPSGESSFFVASFYVATGVALRVFALIWRIIFRRRESYVGVCRGQRRVACLNVSGSPTRAKAGHAGAD